MMLRRGLSRFHPIRRLHVVVGMSGGVDSSVAAYLLRQQGHSVTGLFVTSWDAQDESGASCSGEEDWQEVQQLCRLLDIPVVKKSFVSEFWVDVFEPLVRGYARGETPNPDVACNRRLKFSEMRDFAFRVLGADRFATGHFAQLDRDPLSGRMRLLQSPCDKDQTLFLSQVRASQLENVLFPVGHLNKSQVREIARQAGLPNAEKKSSTGICFVGKRKFGDWIGEYVNMTAGRFIDDRGNVLGEHDGAERFTLGQRARVSGEARRWFVSRKKEDGDVILAPERILSSSLHAREVVWVAECPPRQSNGGQLPVECRFRHTQPLQKATLTLDDEAGHSFRLAFEKPQAGIAPGQTVAIYSGPVCLGGAVISRD